MFEFMMQFVIGIKIVSSVRHDLMSGDSVECRDRRSDPMIGQERIRQAVEPGLH